MERVCEEDQTADKPADAVWLFVGQIQSLLYVVQFTLHSNPTRKNQALARFNNVIDGASENNQVEMEKLVDLLTWAT